MPHTFVTTLPHPCHIPPPSFPLNQDGRLQDPACTASEQTLARARLDLVEEILPCHSAGSTEDLREASPIYCHRPTLPIRRPAFLSPRAPTGHMHPIVKGTCIVPHPPAGIRSHFTACAATSKGGPSLNLHHNMGHQFYSFPERRSTRHCSCCCGRWGWGSGWRGRVRCCGGHIHCNITGC